MDARQPKEVEDARTAIFVKGTHTGEVVNNAMKELVCSFAYCLLHALHV
jgi:ribosome production factor 2